MSLSKSPVLYFGIVLVAVVAALLSAPFIVDWNGYRADIEAQGRKLTGRSVTIGGDISASLFPWPRLTIEDVRIANPAGLDEPYFASAGRIVTRIALAGLFQGNIDVESIDIEKPVVGIERQASGAGNWTFTPDKGLVAGDLFKRIKLENITVTGGEILMTDRRRGEVHRFSGIDAAIAAPQFAGPWRVRALTGYGERDIDIGINTGIWKEGEPLRFSVRAANADGSGLVFSFDGASDGMKAEGITRIEPAEAANGKEDAGGQFRPLVFKAKTIATFDQVKFPEVEVAPREITEGGTLISGSGKLKLGKHISAEANLSAATLNLDELMGAMARNLLREQGPLPIADSLLRFMPDDLSLSATLNVTALTVGGETLDSAVATVDADRNAIRIKELTASLPGRTRVLYEGVFFPGKRGAEAGGSLALETSDLRRLAQWAWPENKEMIAGLWSGSRGHFKLQTDIGLTESRLRLSGAQFELDGELGKAEFVRSSGGREAIDLRVTMGRVDLDSYLQGGLKAFSAAAAQGAGSALQALLPKDNAADVLLSLTADELLLNGVSANNVNLDLASGITGLDLRHLTIGSVGGAELDATGLILDTAAGPDGSIGLEMKAADPRGMLRLLGLVSGDADPPWVSELGETAAKVTLAVKPRDGMADTVLDLHVKSGQVDLTAKGSVAEAEGGFTVQGSTELKTDTSSRMARLFGLKPAQDDSLPARLSIAAESRSGGGYDTQLQLEAFAAHLTYSGTLDPGAAGFGLDGKASARTTGSLPLAAAMGLPLAALPDRVLVIDSPVKAEGNGISLPDLKGRFGSDDITGSITLDGGKAISATLTTGDLSARDVLALALLAPTANQPGLDSSFASGLPFGLTGEIWITPKSLAVHEQFTAKDVQIGITAKEGETAVAIFGKAPSGEDTHIEVTSEGSSEVRKLKGKIIIPVDLESQLKLINGNPVASGHGAIELAFIAEGRSPGGALASLKGSGTYDFEDLRLVGLSPEAFLAAIAKAADSPGITAAFDAMRTGELTVKGKASGFVTVVNGEVAFQALRFETAQSKTELRVVGELALGEIDADLAVGFLAPRDLPGMSVSYAGLPTALARGEDNTELSTHLGVAIMQKGIDELERLRKEQERLAREEEEQRKQDEERLAAYYAQRDELILRQRELRIHAEMQVLEAERLRKRIEEERAANAEISKSELKQRAREIRILRRIARLERAQRAEPAPPPQKKAEKPAAKPKPQKPQPVILVQPETAPVFVSPAPSPSPSQ